MQPALIIAGPTASGKSALAEALAERFGGAVINADAMQCYRGLAIITAQPGPSRVPHLLYGVRDPAEAADVAWWREQALAAMARVRFPILCGGTGMYLRALTQGIAALPRIPPELRRETRAALASRGPAALHAELDPETAAQLRPTDSQRVARAYEVLKATGRGLAAWQREAPLLPPAPWRFAAILLDPPREELRRVIAARFDAMLAAGAVEEVRRLLHLPDDLPAMRAHGVPELRAYLRGEISLAEARERAVRHTIQYTKRQATWFRHQRLAAPQATHRINARFAGLTQFSESLWVSAASFVRRHVDGPDAAA
ncbi:MAG: tRNA (adenosine(37)-N6)-dimethylallyltransferase MiaA [Rhodovarius sp.]|nr:tRNA (adenosine(37)-N6)-dimethylallyltransferase MiaA [Rhodovarius sp.]